MPNINITNSQIQGIFRELMDTWKNQYPVFEKQNALFSRRLPDNNVRFAKYAFKESVPFPKAWDMNVGRQHQIFKDRNIEVGFFPYELTISSNTFDIADDQLGDTKDHIQMSVKRFLQLPQKLYAEYLNGTAVLNPSLMNAYDGSALYATTDGDGAARFGATGGNIMTGNGTTVAGFAEDLYQAQQRFLAFKDTAGEIIFGPEDIAFEKIHVVVPPTLNEIALKVANVEYLRTDLSNTVSETNYFKGKFNVHINNLLTDTSDWFIFLEHSYWKPFLYRQANDVRAIWADMSNSDRAREHGIEGFYADLRVGAGVWMPAVTLKVNN